MKVKIGDRVYDSLIQPIMLILTDRDKGNIAKMDPISDRYCSFPMNSKVKEIESWMDEIIK